MCQHRGMQKVQVQIGIKNIFDRVGIKKVLIYSNLFHN